jgi:streptomycin 6-kinase
MIVNKLSSDLLDRVARHAREWGLNVEDVFETETSAIAFVSRGNQPLVLKVVKQQGDERYSGEILEAFGGSGVARDFEHTGGAVLIERLRPGNSLASVVRDGKDEEATEIIAGVIQQMSASEISSVPQRCATTEDWARGFERYIATDNKQIPRRLVESAQQMYAELSGSQRSTRLLHGDLQHYNVLFDTDRGWLAIDPKGVVGELEYEIGAVLRNPNERPELFLPPSVIDRRLKLFTNRLNLNYERTIGWAFAQGVLSAIWEIEDGFTVDATNPSIRLAEAIRPML